MDRRLPFSHILLAMLRLRGDKQFWGSVEFRRMLKRAIHLFSQLVDASWEDSLLTECPSPDMAARYHPFMKSSRLKGNKALELDLVGKFMARGGGYVSGKSESKLSDLGIVRHRTALAHRTSTEFVASSLAKQKAFLTELLSGPNLKVVNVCFDGATVCHEQVSRSNVLFACFLKV